MKKFSEKQLIKYAKEFNTTALGEIYDLYSPELYRYAMRLLDNDDRAEECVSEVFSRFLSALRRGKGPENFLKAYLFRIAHNWITDYYRGMESRLEEISEENPQMASDEITSRQVEKNEEAQQVRAALLRLTPDQRQVIILKFYEGWRHQEIAETLQKPVGAVKALQHRAISALRRYLAGNEE
jgi:RNA polymerase sigma-70 factor (ECF subfamily)